MSGNRHEGLRASTRGGLFVYKKINMNTLKKSLKFILGAGVFLVLVGPIFIYLFYYSFLTLLALPQILWFLTKVFFIVFAALIAWIISGQYIQKFIGWYRNRKNINRNQPR
jgi:hypothetical protein